MSCWSHKSASPSGFRSPFPHHLRYSSSTPFFWLLLPSPSSCFEISVGQKEKELSYYNINPSGFVSVKLFMYLHFGTVHWESLQERECILMSVQNCLHLVQSPQAILQFIICLITVFIQRHRWYWHCAEWHGVATCTSSSIICSINTTDLCYSFLAPTIYIL